MIATLWWVMLAGAAAILLLVMGLLALAFRGRGTAQSPRAWIVWGGLVFPMTVLTALIAYGLVAGERLLPRAGADVLKVDAVARRWSWTFRQPGPAGTIEATNVLHIPAGRPVDVALTSEDVIHSFWVPRLAGKMDAVPGRTNLLRIEAAQPGVYAAVCAEYCGVGHSRHRFRVVAHDPAGWTAFREGAR